ncbi:MAG: hypothetical protein ACYTGN_15260 [Planctomycetota bacterium]|jgi:hypothetical protein
MTALALVLLLAPGYAGKYDDDPRLKAILLRLPKLQEQAKGRIREAVGSAPTRVDLLVEDAGERRDGRWAETRTKGDRQQLVLFSEYLVLGAHDVEATLVHELFHCLQSEKLGARYREVPAWAREGAALYVARQFGRIDRLVVLAGTDRRLADPSARLNNGLETEPHSLWDYGEDLCAFLAARKRHGDEKMRALVQAMLETPDPRAAIKQALDEDFDTFRAGAAELARALLTIPNAAADLVRKAPEMEPEAALKALGAIDNVFSPEAHRVRAGILLRLGRREEALEAVRLSTKGTPRLGEALLLELKILRGTPAFAVAYRRALLDLEPFTIYDEVKKLGAPNPHDRATKEDD